jgi:Flp pilus assembly pilin Flp
MECTRENQGQAVVEYVLMLFLVVAAVAIIGTGFRKSLYGLWEGLSGEIAAGCPGCPKDNSIRVR